MAAVLGNRSSPGPVTGVDMTLVGVARAGVVLLLAGSMAACGAVSNLLEQESEFAQGSAEEIFAAAKKDLGSLRSVHVQGDLQEDDERLTIDLSVSKSGDCTGTMGKDGATFEILVAEHRIFFRGDEAFYRASGATPEEARQAASVIGDRWVEGDDKIVGDLCQLDELFDLSEKGNKTLKKVLPGEVTVVSTAEVAGIETVQLTSTRGKRTYGMYVGVEEPHHIIQLTASGTKDANGTITFTNHDIPVQTSLPDKADIFVVPAGG